MNAVLPLLALALVLPATTHAAAPGNDDRTAAQPVGSLPADVTGTTTGATAETTEPESRCGTQGPSVWYSATAGGDGRIAVTVQADGDLDLVLDVYRRVRSQTESVACDASDDKGAAATDFKGTKDTTYLIRVTQRPNSVAGTFALHVSAPIVPATLPGTALPQRGVTQTLTRVENPDDAWSVVLHEGRSYRIHLSGRGGTCSTRASLYAPGAQSFGDAVVRRFSCGAYLLVTPGPGESGRYAIRVQAASGVRTPQPYHLQVAGIGPDDTAPGLVVHNHEKARGSLRGGGIDVVDLYRFTIEKRSVTFLDLKGGGGGFSLQLLNDRGRRLASGEDSIHRGTRPGRYFVAVRASGNASGRYTLTRATRVITKTKAEISGSADGLRVTATTTPSTGGPYEIIVQRFDPLEGWIFAKRFRVTGSGGTAGIGWVPPGVGRYRARASFLGTRDSAASDSTYSYIVVGGAGDR